MKMIDLSHAISEATPVYPGTEPPVISIPCTISRQGFTEKKITLYSHTGTHMDAPSHILSNGKSLDQYTTDQFVGRAAIADLTKIDSAEIGISDLAAYEPLLPKVDFLLFCTGWYTKWGREEYFRDYPVLTAEAAEWLARFPLKGIGVDMISVDRTDTDAYPIHRIFLEKSILIVENLTNLAKLPETIFSFFSLPLKIQDADGSPVRAVAMIAADGL